MTRKPIYSQFLSDLKLTFKKTVGRIYFDAPQVRGIYLIVPTIVLDTSDHELALLWGRWGLVFWYGKYHL